MQRCSIRPGRTVALLAAAAVAAPASAFGPITGALVNPGLAPPVAPPRGAWTHCVNYTDGNGASRIDPACFFEALVARYRILDEYRDSARVTQVTQRAGQAPRRVETEIDVAVEGGRLHVETPTSRLRRSFGIDVPGRTTPELEAARLRWQIWLAPHMALKYADRPDKDFRAGVTGGMTVTEAEAVTIEDRPMVHLEMRSDDSVADGATFDLYVDPESMLVERISGHQQLPDGATYQTTVEISGIVIGDDGNAAAAPPTETPPTEPFAGPTIPDAPVAPMPAPRPAPDPAPMTPPR